MPIDPARLRDAARRLHAGLPVAFPTETVYGLGAAALNADAVARVFTLKGRPASNPLIIHTADIDAARALAAEWPDDAQRLASAFWPGPLTIVVPRNPEIPAVVTAGGPTIAVRVPDHPVASALLREFGGPLVGPSANRSGQVSPTTAAHVLASFPDLLVLDGGPCVTGIESTVIELDPSPRILRPGILTADVLSQALGKPVANRDPSSALPARSPGLQPRHYAPNSPATIVGPEQLSAILSADQPVAVLAISELSIRPPHRLIPMPALAAAYAASLYSALRSADAGAPTLIAIERPPTDGPESALWHAVHDRLHRATSPRSEA